MKNFETTLPKKRTGNYLILIANYKLYQILLFGIALYIGIVIIFSLIECISSCYGFPLVSTNNNETIGIWELLYFNLVTILTIGYGDFIPVGIGRLLTLTESILGVILLGLIISLLTTKLLAAPKKTIVFSKYGYYCTNEESFLIIFVNTTNSIFLMQK